ncbi:V-type ATP synthase subunit K [Treponema phagedenis]|uniref:V-type ATP synthase subunit K n=1 Tax=Treponema phagedenis TaxID=162 RepID=A0A0B7GUT8_TREPH|nr:ATP synthase subunit K [Treponema phagedenis]EFW38439.1 V-type sodium ATPase, K subunit [Treponema phagedenis F0421]NVP25544.1 V-type ATP synthase subunit K [Treponema phagedenis]QEJ94352.1 V-type ATP synthase subunit K [Treponema phagedenis]QEJ97344.1 V-type ATP synthase subunit K [Treponema phagedenis]QEK01730.1 V-type ATP synthase subunit K [Treponema phagedenis]
MNFGLFGAAAALGISAIGSAIGLAIAGQGTIGAWKRCYMSNKPAPFILVAFAGAPLTQTIYGYLLMDRMLNSQKDAWFLLGLGLVCGLAIAISAVAQGKASASGSDALAETGKGFAQYITIVGLCETVALFVMVFGLIKC